jgi:hypothetical protein
MNKDYKNVLKKIEEIKKIKTDCLVRARRGEFWIKEHSPELNSVIRNLENTKRYLKEIFEIRRLPWWVHVIVHTKMIISDPIRYFKKNQSNYRKVMVESYWEFKRLKKEWEDDFDVTEEAIDRDYHIYYKANKTVKKMESLLKQWEKKMKQRKKYK